MPILADSKPAKKPLLPPDEAFWQKYSAHHEFPLASIASLFIHGLAVGIMVFVAFVLNMSWQDEAAQPPRLDVVQLEGGEGMGMGPGPVGGSPDGDNRPRTEIVESNPMTPPENTPPNPMASATPPELVIPSINLEPDANDPLDDLKRIEAEAVKATTPKTQPSTSTNSQPIIKAGQNIGSGRGPLGIGGKGPGGFGGGLGKNPNGSGMGGGGLTRQQWLANRWDFNLSGDPKAHIQKLIAIGFVYAYPSADDIKAKRRPHEMEMVYIIQDLKKRPIAARLEPYANYKDAVVWQNTLASSVQGIARELKLPYVPPFTLMLLPKERQQAIADEEARYLKGLGLSENEVERVMFDFRLKGAKVEPIAIGHLARK